MRSVQLLVSVLLLAACAADSSDSLLSEGTVAPRDAGPEPEPEPEPEAPLAVDAGSTHTEPAADPCEGAQSNGGYCGGPLGGDEHVLYTCRDGNTLSFVECEYGCSLQPAGTNDRCVATPDADLAYHLPLACGTSTTLTQGNESGYSHGDIARYAYDFRLPRGSTLVAMHAGTVRAVRDDIRPGHACWAGGGPACADQVNRVVLDHPDGTSTLYLHLDSVSVAVGATVARGQKIGLSGGTGWSTGPHAHVQRQVACASSYWCQSVPLRFAEVAENDGVPIAGATVTAGPCP